MKYLVILGDGMADRPIESLGGKTPLAYGDTPMMDELAAKGEETDLAQIEEDIRKRDEQDMNRKIAPLKQAEDAVLIDSSHMTIDEVVQAILDLCK